jgi:hypothetical protein
MFSHQHKTLVLGVLALVISGCSDSDKTLSPGVMGQAEHSHYHVHAVDAAHEHTHPDQLGGHSHSHKHPDSDARL